MKGISVVPSLMFQQYCLMLHYCVNGEKLNRSDIQFQPRNKVIVPLSSESNTPEYDRTQIYLAEQALMRILREGDVKYKDAVAQANHLFNPVYPPHRESLQKAIIASTAFTTLCIREAIQAGISTDTAYAIGEGYIDSMSQCKVLSDLTSLNLSMFEDFLFRVRKHRTHPNVSAQIRSCRDYIELHAEQELKLSTLAKQVGYSEYYLSRKFKQEMGVSISTYIKYVRVERSKMMLISSGIPIAQIAESLHFASSSHFSDAFQDILGKTPQQYRRENQKF
jgi:AraC-like DNA-binding protein